MKLELDTLHAVEVAALKVKRGDKSHACAGGGEDGHGHQSISTKMDEIAEANDALESEARELIEKIRSLSLMSQRVQVCYDQ